MEAVSGIFAGFSRSTVLQALVHFVGAPLLLERVARVFFLRTHVNISAADAAVLSQRLGRAGMALNLVQGAVRTLAQPEHSPITFFASTELGR